ncbi:ATP-binding protein [Solilutibacter silvestris]|uniref:histidine kinase n=1 Tax=Solilutibacter silvestris TaxID=1645665 RepID=A0A2K1PYD3_9GAMM|nr:ATP-binding protein [Lysobacter silvestris]PNS07802.1 Histidine kinase-, DNA gyrase B-, and HSP90-like ATPase [Lysobacter silvestris]
MSIALVTNADPAPSRDNAGLRNLQQLIQLRWIAVVGQVLAIAFVHFVLHIALPLRPMLLVLLALVAYNLASQIVLKRRTRVTDRALLLALLVDVATLTAQLHFSGGPTNPFLFLFLLHVVLGAILLRTASSWIIAVATSACVLCLMSSPGPVVLPADLSSGLASLYVQGLLICFALVATLLVVFITRIGRILRERDAHLATMRQRAAEEEHIVRMGLLASGAAHELGTPLSTLAVILGDWQHLPHFASDPELLQDVVEMQVQVLRCKAIVTGILQSAGETRGEAPQEIWLRDFFDDLADEWRTTRPTQQFDYRNQCADNPLIVSDAGLKQMICNVLDNALDVSPQHVAMHVALANGDVVIEIADHGPGFAPTMLEQLGKPYQSSKDEPGHGLGLFLSVNVARSLGGTLKARNTAQGAVVTMTLPLSALTMDDGDDNGD